MYRARFAQPPVHAGSLVISVCTYAGPSNRALGFGLDRPRFFLERRMRWTRVSGDPLTFALACSTCLGISMPEDLDERQFLFQLARMSLLRRRFGDDVDTH